MIKRYHIQIEGMGCMHCVKSVTDGLTAIGATVENCVIGGADVAFDGDVKALSEAIADRGFTATAVTEQ